MMEAWWLDETLPVTGVIRDENRLEVARGNRRDVKMLIGTYNLVRGMLDAFPGLVDGETEVGGGDLGDWLNVELTAIGLQKGDHANPT